MADLAQTAPIAPAACPSCRLPMQSETLRDHLGAPLTLDLCFGCQGLWFDTGESVRLGAGSVIELFRLIHNHAGEAHQPLATRLTCPRCPRPLDKGFDVTRSGRYVTYRCPQQHGRFSAFAAFMVEKGFVRPLTAPEIQDLAQRIGTVHCNACGAPVDLRQDSACSYCHAPLSLLDPQAVQRALADYDRRQQQRQVQADPKANPDAWADALIAVERERNRAAREARGATAFDVDIPVFDLLATGVALVLASLGDD